MKTRGGRGGSFSGWYLNPYSIYLACNRSRAGHENPLLKGSRGAGRKHLVDSVALVQTCDGNNPDFLFLSSYNHYI